MPGEEGVPRPEEPGEAAGVRAGRVRAEAGQRRHPVHEGARQATGARALPAAAAPGLIAARFVSVHDTQVTGFVLPPCVNANANAFSMLPGPRVCKSHSKYKIYILFCFKRFWMMICCNV